MSSYPTRLLPPYPPPEKKTQGIASLSVCVQLKGTVPRDFRHLVFCQRHRWQMEKIFYEKNFNYFVWTPLGSRVSIYINFCLQVHFKESADWYSSNYLPPVSLIPVVHLYENISANFRKNSKWPQCYFRGLGDGDSWKKTEAKNLVTLSL